MAIACNTRVEVEDARTEFTQTFASPEGYQTVEVAVVPQRAKHPDGKWGPIDTTLRRVGDTIVPTASAANLRFSAGGAGPFVTMTHAGKAFSLTWPTALPAPVIDGNQATYLDVLPGADLVVRANDYGFTHLLVVKTAAAAADRRVRQAKYHVGGDLVLENASHGGLVAWAGDEVVATAQEPAMWDTPRQLSARFVAMSGVEPQGRKVSRVRAAFSGRELTLTPDLSMLDDPAARFPIEIDPPWNPGENLWAYATSNNTNGQTIDQTIGSGDYSPAAETLSAGNDTSGRLYRSFMRFPISTVSGKNILDVGLAGKADHTWKCTENRPNYFYRTASFSSQTRLSWSGPALQLLLGNNNVHANEASCPAANMPFEVSTTALINDVEASATAGAANYYVGICACNTTAGANESNQERWMRYFTRDFKLNISYNTKPGTPTLLTVDNKACATGAARPFVKAATPTLRARLSDADGNTMTGRFETARIRYNDAVGPVSMTRDQASVANGGTAQTTLPTGVLDGADVMVGTGDWDDDGFPDALSRDSVGDLYLLPGTGNGNVESRTEIGHGFTGYTFAGMTDWDADGHQDFIAREDATGALWLYPGTSSRTSHGTRAQIGSGWGPYAFAGLDDWDKDGHQDIVARDGSGVMWLYPGESTRVGSTQTRVTLGSGWSTSGVGYLGVRDWDKDTNPDIVIYDGAGALWGYPGTGTRGLYGARFALGTGWTGFQALVIDDVNSDAKVDILARPSGSTTFWSIYPGSGARSAPGTRYDVATTGVSHGGQYAFRANASDGTDWAAAASAWCEFEVDTVPPAVPTVISDIYKEGPAGCPGGACGSVGQTGQFTFSSSSDTQSFLWGWSDPPSTTLNPGVLGGSVSIDFTPPSGGPRTLYVRAIDRAGNEANRQYQFYVAPESPAIARWLLNETGGTTASDDTGNGSTLTLSGGATFGVPGRIAPGNDGQSRSALGFDGVDDRATSAGSVIADTSKSFSVAAWVKLTATDAVTHDVISQAGSNATTFYLQYHNTNTWRVVASNADVASPTYIAATATSVPRANVWTHVAGTYDSAAKTLRVYVNGELEATATGVTMWDANGVTRIGGTSMPWNGALAEVQVWNRLVSDVELRALANAQLVGEWKMEDVGFGPSYDSSNMAHDLNFFGGAEIPSANAGKVGTGLRLDGVDDYAAPDNPVLYTNQSFTVSVWARVTATTSIETFLAQEASGSNPGFMVYYDNSTNRWKFKMYASATSDETTVTMAEATATTPTSYHHLVGVYDAQRQEIRLYVDNALVATRAMNAAFQPWHADQRLLIGMSQALTNPAYADLDEVRVYQGVVKDVTTIP